MGRDLLTVENGHEYVDSWLSIGIAFVAFIIGAVAGAIIF